MSGRSTCQSCGKDYSENLFALYYCLKCDLSVCEDCVEAEKVESDETRWKCPGCGSWLNKNASQLIRA
ncbi:MAG: hypothetical protein Kow0069_00270 [Promethearchaeota archaeon]